MRHYGEERIGLFSPELVKSALARPQNAAEYENADLIRQSATLFYGFIKDHPWQGGNKRTATALMDWFLFRNGVDLRVERDEAVKLSLKVEADE
jgi:death on curing protein